MPSILAKRSQRPIRRWERFTIFVLFFVVSACVLWWFFPPRPMMSKDNIPQALLPIVLLRSHSLTFDSLPPAVTALKEGGVAPTAYLRSMYYFSLSPSKHIVSSYPIFAGLMITPVYAIYAHFFPNLLQIDAFTNFVLWWANYSATLVFTIASMILMFLVFRTAALSRFWSYIGVTLYVFATEVISVSSRFVSQHTITLFFIPLMILGYQKKRLTLFATGVVGAFLTRPSTLFLSLPFMIGYAMSIHHTGVRKSLFQGKNIIWTICTAFIILLAGTFALWYMRSILDGAWVFGSQYQIDRLTGSITNIMPILFSPGRGLLFFSPIFIFAGIEMIRQRKTMAVYAFSVIAYLLFMSLWDMWWGGWTFGYRMVIEVVPVCMLFFMFYLQRFLSYRPLHQACLVLFICLSILFQSVIGGHYYSCGFNGPPDSLEDIGAERTTWKMWHGSEIFTCINHIQRL